MITSTALKFNQAHKSKSSDTRQEIRKKMKDLDHLHQELTEVLTRTQEVANGVSDKIRGELKIAKKSLFSISERLNEGVMLLNYRGDIIHLNKVGAEIFGVTEEHVLDKCLTDIIDCGNQAIDDMGQIIEKQPLIESFFINLSEKILAKIKSSPPRTDKYQVCNECLISALPFCVELEGAAAVKVKVTLGNQQFLLKITSSILDNNPERLEDLTYVFLFNPA